MISRKMKIEAVVTCVGYDDFLQVTLPYTLPHVDHLTVVTTPEDWRTKKLCHRLGVHCVDTHCFYRDATVPVPAAAEKTAERLDARGGEIFNKARGINYGLMQCRCDDWLLHLDADIVLPPRTRHFLMNADLQADCIYGVDRIMCPSYDAWTQFHAEDFQQYEWSCYVRPPRNGYWRLGSRLAHGDYGGYTPIGYFQLWHGSARRRYPNQQDASAEHTDVLHALQWDRTRRILLPELYAVHLESAPASQGANWRGRRTARFEPGVGTGTTEGTSRHEHAYSHA